MIWREVVLERRGEYHRLGLVPAGRWWWLPVLRVWLKFVWRWYDSGRIDAQTAWDVAEGLCGIVRDPVTWHKSHVWIELPTDEGGTQ